MMSSNLMKAVLLRSFGGVEQMYIGEAPKPIISSKDLLIRVKAAGLNRADLLQRAGKYPPPPGASTIMGLEVSGEVESVGKDVKGWKVGEKAMALLSGGGYSQFVCVPSTHVMPIPKDYTFEQAAGIPETFCTVFQSLFTIGNVQEHQNILIHGGASGIGTSAIQLAKTIPGVRVFTTAGTDSKCRLCESLGADLAVNYKTHDFQTEILKALESTASETLQNGQEKGVDFILDFVGQAYLAKNLEIMRTDAKLVYLAMLSGTAVKDFNLGILLRKRISLIGTTLRSRSDDYKTKLVQEFSKYALAKFDENGLKPVIDKVYDWTNIQDAHAYLESNASSGKIIINGM